MTDPTNQQLADIVLLLFERWPELRPTGLKFDKRYGWHLQCKRSPELSLWIDDEHATQLCESSMVRGLALEKITCEVGIDLVMSAGWDIVLPPEGVICHGDTLVQALAAACNACLDANEKRGET